MAFSAFQLEGQFTTTSNNCFFFLGDWYDKREQFLEPNHFQATLGVGMNYSIFVSLAIFTSMNMGLGMNRNTQLIYNYCSFFSWNKLGMFPPIPNWECSPFCWLQCLGKVSKISRTWTRSYRTKARQQRSVEWYFLLQRSVEN